MKVVPPIPMTDGILLSSNIAEADYALWNSATAYSVGDRVIRTNTDQHKVYQRLIAGTTATIPEDDATNWILVGPTNRWKMFDTSSSTATLGYGTIEVEFDPGRIDTLALLEVVASTITVEMTTVAGTIYSTTVDMVEREVDPVTWSGYFFGRFNARNSLVLTDLPISSGATVSVVLDNGAAQVECGTLTYGLSRDFGDLQFGVRAGIVDYSRKEVDAWGVATFVERSYAKRFEGRLIVPNSQVDSLHKFLAGLRATPSLWVGASGYEMLVVFGWFREFAIDLAYPTESYCSLTIEGIA